MAESGDSLARLHRLVDGPVQPRPEFADALRDRLLGELGGAPDTGAAGSDAGTGAGTRSPARGERPVAPRRPRPARAGLPATLATAALVLLVLAAAFAVFRGSRPVAEVGTPLPAPADRGTPAPAATAVATPVAPPAVTVVDLALPAGALPAWDDAWSALDYISIPPDEPPPTEALPGSRMFSNDAGDIVKPRAFRYPSQRLDYVLEGSYAVRGDGPMQVVRGDNVLVDVPPGIEVVLEPGDALLTPPTTDVEYFNPNQNPALLVQWTAWAEDGLDEELPGWNIINYDVNSGAVIPRGPLRLRLRRVEFAPGDVWPAPPAGIQRAVELPLNAAGERASPTLFTMLDSSIQNSPTTRTSVTGYVVTLEPAADQSAPPATPAA